MKNSISFLVCLFAFLAYENQTSAQCNNFWSQKADFGGIERTGAVGFSIGDKGYMGTGKNGGTYYDDFWEYNPATDTWSQKANFGGTARYGAVGFSTGNKGYIGTGRDGSDRDDFWEYDTTSNVWTQKANFGGGGRLDAIGFSIGNKGYIGTGYGFGYLEDFWEYDSTSNSWTQKADFGGGDRSGAVGFSIGSKGYIGTGRENFTDYDDFWEYDTLYNTWSQKTDFGGTERLGATGFSIGNKGYIGTGYTGFYTIDFWEYDPGTSAWTLRANFSGTGRSGAVGFSIGNKGYIGTGSIFNGLENDFWEYTPTLNAVITTTDITCIGTSTGTASSAATGGSPPYTYLWSTSETTSSISGLAAGTYDLTLTDFLGCSVTSNVSIVLAPEGTWRQKAFFGGTARSDAVGFSIGSKGYIGTGYGSSYWNDFWEYDTVSNTWSQMANFGGTARNRAVGFSIGGKGYIGTGYDGSYKNDFWEYDTTTNAWTQKANFGGSARYNATGFSIGDKGYIGTGYGGFYTNDFWEYDTTSNAWTQKANFLGDARSEAAGFSIGNKGFIGTGKDGSSIKIDFWEYDTTTDVWTKKANFGGTYRSEATGFSIGNKGYIGLGNNGAGNDFWEYDTAINTWTRSANFGGTARERAVGFSIGNKGYIGTGWDGVQRYNDFWEYTPPPISANISPTDINCSGYITGVNVTAEGSSPPFTYLWSTSETTDSISGLTAGTYSITVSDSIGCTVTDSITIAVNAPGSWAQKANFGGTARTAAVGFSIGAKGYIGTGSTGLTKYNDFWEYDTTTNVWTQKANFAGTARDQAVGFSISNKGYIGTGDDGSRKKDFWEYDPGANAWTQKANFGGTSRYGAIGFSIGNNGYIGTGWDGSGAPYRNDFWEYDPGSNVWTPKANASVVGRADAVGFSIGNKGYIGTGTASNGWSTYDDFWEYDPGPDVWIQKADFGGITRANAVGFSIGSKGYIGTGGYSSTYKSDFWKYDPDLDIWTQQANFGGTARISAVGFSIGNKGYIGTGDDGSSAIDFWEYTPPQLSAKISISNLACTMASIYVTVGGGSAPFTYLWSNTGTTDSISGLIAGRYNVTVSDAIGCSASDSIIIVLNTPGSWRQRADFGGVTRVGPVGFSIGNKGYIGTGRENFTNYNDFWEYDTTSNTWSQKANFGGTGRYGATGFSIGNKGYIGTGWDGSYKIDFWEYDPSTNAWTQKANFGGTARWDATGFSVGNKGYMGTGQLNSTSYNDFWVYDPGTDIWTQKADVGGTARKGATGFSIGDKGYIGTGYYAGSHKNDFWEYDTTSNAWTQKANFGGTGRENATGFSIGNRGYIGTGTNGSTRYKDFWEYDTATNTWLQKANLGGTVRERAVGFSIGDKGYIGTGKNGSPINDFWEYSPYLYTNISATDVVCNGASTGTANVVARAGSTPYTYLWSSTDTTDSISGLTVGTYYVTVSDSIGCTVTDSISIYLNTLSSWTQKADFGGIERGGAAGFSIGSKGYIGTGDDGSYTNDFWEYDTTSNTWSQKANFGGTARWDAIGFSIGSKGYIGTGYDGSYKNDFWEYDTTSNTWTQKANFGGTAREQAVGFSIGSKGYVGTGYDGSNKNDFWEYDPGANSWSQKANFGGTARRWATGLSIGSKGYIGTGYDGSYTKDFWEYDTTSNIWTQKANFGGTARYGATSFSIGSKGYIGTGWRVNALNNDFWEYDTTTNNWLQKANISSMGRTHAVGFSIGSMGYVGTGWDSSSFTFLTNTFWEFDPVLNLGISVVSNDVTCYGGSDGAATITVNSGTSPYSYLWSTGATATSVVGLSVGMYSVTVSDSLGCASNSSVIVTEPLLIQDSTTVNICDNDSVFLEGSYQNIPGIYYDTLMAMNGCDSAVSTLLAVDQAYSIGDPTVTICNGDSTMIYGAYGSIAGMYYDSLTTNLGCDSIYSTQLSFYTTYSLNDPGVSSCSGDSSLIYGIYRSVAGTYSDSLTSIDGCDSVHSTVFTINPIYSIIDSAMAVCTGDSGLIYGTYRSTAGTYFDSLQTFSGCDSVHSRVLTVNPTYANNDPGIDICSGDSVIIYGVYQKITGSYYDSLVTTTGCDSINSTILMVNQLPAVSISNLDTTYYSTDAVVTMTGTPSGGTFSGTGGVSGNQFFPSTGVNTYTVTYSYTDSLGCFNSTSQTVNVIALPIGIPEDPKVSEINIYPNPNTGKFKLEMNLALTESFEIKITNALGQTIYCEQLGQFQGTYIKQLDLIDSPSGVYNLQLMTDSEVITRQIIVE